MQSGNGKKVKADAGCFVCTAGRSTKFPDIRYGYLVEIKNIKRSEAGSKPEQKIAELVDEAKTQLAQYCRDPHLDKIGGNITWVCPILVFHGWELVTIDCYEV